MGKTALFILAASFQLLASDFHARVEVLAFADDVQLQNQVTSLLAHRFEDIAGVITVGKEPDYLVVAIVRTHTDTVAVSVYVTEQPDEKLAAALLRGASREHTQSVQLLLNSMPRIAGLDLRIGPLDTLAVMCTEIVKSIDAGALEGARRYPKGSDDANVRVENFMLRMGAKRVQKGE